MANCGLGLLTTICSGADLTQVTSRTTGSCARLRERRRRRWRQWWRSGGAVDGGGGGGGGGGGAGGGAVPLPIPPFPVDPPPNPLPPDVALSDHRAGTRHLWGGAASGAAIGAFDPRHARRPKGRHLRAGWLRRCGLRPLPPRPDFCGRPADQEAGGVADQEGAGAWLPARCSRRQSWGRFFGQTIHNNYQAFAAPSANGDLGGFQGGIDLLRGL